MTETSVIKRFNIERTFYIHSPEGLTRITSVSRLSMVYDAITLGCCSLLMYAERNCFCEFHCLSDASDVDQPEESAEFLHHCGNA